MAPITRTGTFNWRILEWIAHWNPTCLSVSPEYRYCLRSPVGVLRRVRLPLNSTIVEPRMSSFSPLSSKASPPSRII